MNQLYEGMKECFLQKLETAGSELVALAEESREKKSEEGSSTGTEKFVRVTAEIPRGNGSLSRCRFDVKVPDGIVKLSPQQLNEGIYEVAFENLVISFIDSARNMVYFRADDYSIEEVK